MASKKHTLLKPKKTKHVSILNEDIAKQVERMIHEGKNLKECAVAINISDNTLYQWKWDNTLGFADMIEKAQLERELIVAKEFTERLMQMENNEDGKLNTRLLTIKQKEAEYRRSNLVNAKRMYDNRQINNNVIVLPTPILGGMIEKDNEEVK